jgi:hypothetical protein
MSTVAPSSRGEQRQQSRQRLRLAIALACVVPVSAGLAGALQGSSMILDGDGFAASDLDSHFRYLSGLLLGIGVAFLALLPGIERRTSEMRLLTFLVVIGGLARLAGWLVFGDSPGWTHGAALIMELGVTPWLCLWQTRVARLFEKGESA